MNNGIVFISMAIFWIWEQRNHRWEGVLGALSGKYAIPPRKTPLGNTP